MKFHHIDGVQKQKRRLGWLLWPFAAVVFLGGIYLLLVALAPQVALPFVEEEAPDRVAYMVKQSQPGDHGDRLYIPRINVDVPIATGSALVLEKGAWHRSPENGNPEKGGNFVLSAHRFSMGLTPQQTRAKSPFYHIESLKKGDQLFVDYDGKRYAYTVNRRFDVPRSAVEIEGPSREPKLTLYSCDLRGEQAGRIVLEASPQGEVVGLKEADEPDALTP